MALLRFIEQRFRSGIRIAPEEIQKYYQETLVPQYTKSSDAPPLDRISNRIQEILLQQQVNILLNDWLKSLKEQGQVEILDPAFAEPATPTPQPGSASPGEGGGL
jgi:peptidyl-prolyl cis-trans isomerase SurA